MTPTTSLLLISLSVITSQIIASTPPPCPSGTVRRGSVCKPCPAGTFHEYSDRCAPCPMGTYNPFPGAQGGDLCLLCDAGTFSAVMGATTRSQCRKCPAGLDSPPGSSLCINCPPGTRMLHCRSAFLLNGACYRFHSAGQLEFQGPQKLRCIPCEVGDDRFGFLRPTLPKCPSCPGLEGIVNNTCQLCPPGQGAPGFQAKQCSPCMDFHVNDGSVGQCSPCKAGYIGNSKNQASRCVPCPRGTFKGEEDAVCKPCKPNENSFMTGATTCRPDNTPCASNFFRSNTGTCQRCTRKERYDRKTNDCVACLRNQASLGGISSECVRCPKGAVGGEKGCECDVGWGLIAGGRCQKCRPGTYRAQEKNFTPLQCRKCRRGTFAPKAGMDECLPCPLGTAQLLEGQAKCFPESKACPDGLVLSYRKNQCTVPGTNCPPDHTRYDSVGASALEYCYPVVCPAGTFEYVVYVSDRYIYKECDSCDFSSRFDLNSAECIRCEDDEFSEGGLSTECKKCKPGLTNVDGKCKCIGGTVVKNQCIKCPAGTIWYRDLPGPCIECPAGTFADTGRLECRVCPKGKFSKARSTVCRKCPKGTTTFGLGEADCVLVESMNESLLD